MEHYLEAILEVSGSRGYARCSELAERLGVSRSTVTEMLRKLGGRGLVIYAPCEPVVLTAEGRRSAALIRERHRVLQALLLHVGVPEPAVRGEACVLEHALKEETIEHIRNFVDRNFVDGRPVEPSGSETDSGPNRLRETPIST